MDTAAFKSIDRAAWPVAAVISRGASCLFRFRRPDPRPLILRPGGMGDLILLTIAAEELGCDPKSFLWIVESRSRVWARHLGLDHICYDQGFRSQNWKTAGRFAIVVNSEQRFGLSQAAALLACAGNAELTCFATNRAAVWAHRRVPYDPDQAHEVRAFQRLLSEALGKNFAAPDAPPQRARAFGVAENPVVGLGGLQSESRAFSEDKWVDFIRPWSARRPFWIASSETDRPMARRLVARFPDRARLFEGSFGSLCSLIAKSERILTVDGGFLHIASYYGVPTTAVFTSGRDRKWAPLAPGSHLIRRTDLACQPCTWFGQVPPCRYHFACKDITYERHVHAAAQ